MRLAAHKAIFSKQRVARMAEDGDLSLRAAAKLIPKDAEKVALAKQRKAEKDAKDAEARRSNGAIKELLDWCAADELFFVMKIVWDEEQIKKLADLLVDHLKPKPQTMPDIPAAFDRRIAPATA